MALLHHHFVQLQIYSQRIFASCNESAGKYTVAKKYNCPSQNSNGLALQPTSTFSSLSPISHAGRLHKVPLGPSCQVCILLLLILIAKQLSRNLSMFLSLTRLAMICARMKTCINVTIL